MGTEGGGLLLVHAHPDDEVLSTGGAIAATLAAGRRVDLVTCTGGEEGEIHDPDLDPDQARSRLGEIRAAELACAVAALAGSGTGNRLNLHLLGYRDSGMMGSDANANPASFWQADLEVATRRLVAIAREARPAVMVSYDENGSYGHPDHIQAHRLAAAAYQAAADPGRFPDAGSPHAVARLYQTAFSRDGWMGFLRAMTERGIGLPWGFDPDAASDEAPFGVAEADISVRWDVSEHAAVKRAAMACHRTQRQDFGWILDLPADLQAQVLGSETFVESEPHGPLLARILDSLFEGL